MTDNPSEGPGDNDRIIMRPMPGGARSVRRMAPPMVPPRSVTPPPVSPRTAPSPAQTTPPAIARQPDPTAEAIAASTDPLAIAAAPLFHLLGHLRNTATAPDPGDIRERTWRELRGFERRARELGVPPLHLRFAHYALCAALDDVVLNMPWGSQGRWRDEPLAKALHHDETNGAGFFEQLRTLRDSLPDTRPVIELMFICLSLGMMGPYRALPDGRAQLERVRHHTFELIEQASPGSPDSLAPDATGIDAHFEPAQRGLPVWVGASAALAFVALLYIWWLTGLNGASDAVYRAALAAPPAAMPALVRPPATPPPPPPPAPIAPGPADRLRAALADLPDVEVIPGGAATILRLPAQVLFPRPNATLATGPLPDRLAKALQSEAGQIRVLAYTDSQPAHSVAFPSNFALSAARAKAVRSALTRTLTDPGRVTAEGRADADPIAPNTTAAGRERNRRIDILLAERP